MKMTADRRLTADGRGCRVFGWGCVLTTADSHHNFRFDLNLFNYFDSPCRFFGFHGEFGA